MATIESVTFGGETDKRIVLAQEGFAAVMSVGNAWNTLRVACRFAFGDNGSALTGNPQFYFGVMNQPTAGLANGALTPVAGTHFWGITPNTATWTYGTNKYTWTASNPLRWCKYEGVTFTAITTNATATLKTISYAQNTYRGWMVLDLIRSGGNLSGGFLASDHATLYDANEDGFRNSMQAFPTSALASQTGVLVGASTGNTGLAASALDEATYGDLNSVYIAWDQVTPMYVSELLYIVKD